MLLRRISVALHKNWYYWGSTADGSTADGSTADGSIADGSTADVIFIVGVKKMKNYKLILCTVYFDK
jgi:hypothetical protein